MGEGSYSAASEVPQGTRAAVELRCICGPVSPIITINSVPIHALKPESVINRIGLMLDCPYTHVVNHIPADPVVIARRDPSFQESLQRADLNLPDGMAVVWAARALGVRDIRERVYGPDFMLEFIRWGVERGIRHALVGGAPLTLDKLVAVLNQRFTGVRIVSAYSPSMRGITREGVLEDLSHLDVEADIIWVGLGTPKQQLWADMARESSKARVISTVGAAFDFIAGTKRQAPRWMQDAGLEWLFRFVNEPRRLWRRYLYGNLLFLWSVAAERSRRFGDHKRSTIFRRRGGR